MFAGGYSFTCFLFFLLLMFFHVSISFPSSFPHQIFRDGQERSLKSNKRYLLRSNQEKNKFIAQKTKGLFLWENRWKIDKHLNVNWMTTSMAQYFNPIPAFTCKSLESFHPGKTSLTRSDWNLCLCKFPYYAHFHIFSLLVEGWRDFPSNNACLKLSTFTMRKSFSFCLKIKSIFFRHR